MGENKAYDKKDFKYIVRVLNTDIDGKKPIGHALLKIKGVKYMFGNAVLRAATVDMKKKTGYLNADEIKYINNVLKDPVKFNIPEWMFNRRKDYETGDSIHGYGSDLDFLQMNDKKRLQKAKSYRGLRYHARLPVRGQRTKSNFRRGKSLGVAKKGKK